MLKTIREIIAYRQMIVGLVRKDLRGRYKGSVLGFLWTFINPLLQLVIYGFFFQKFLMRGSQVGSYYLYLFIGLIPWIFISSAVSGGSTSVLAQKDLVKKIYFPREVLPIAYVTSCLVNMLLSFIIVIAAVLFNHFVLPTPNLDMHAHLPTLKGLLFFPVIVIIEYLLCLGIAMITSAITVYFRDLEHILGLVTMAWFYATPIVYVITDDMFPEWTRNLITYANPAAPIVEAYRAIFYEGKTPQMKTLLLATGLGLLFLIVGFLLFGTLKKHFAEEL